MQHHAAWSSCAEGWPFEHGARFVKERWQPSRQARVNPPSQPPCAPVRPAAAVVVFGLLPLQPQMLGKPDREYDGVIAAANKELAAFVEGQGSPRLQYKGGYHGRMLCCAGTVNLTGAKCPARLVPQVWQGPAAIYPLLLLFGCLQTAAATSCCRAGRWTLLACQMACTQLVGLVPCVAAWRRRGAAP